MASLNKVLRHALFVGLLSLFLLLLIGPVDALAAPVTKKGGKDTSAVTRGGPANAITSQSGAGPAIKLTEYQKRWVEDHSRFKIGMWSRQAGKSFATSLEAVLDCYSRKTKWVFLSSGERQSRELMATAAMHAQAIGAAVQEIEGEWRDEKDTRNTYKQLEIVFENGSRIVGLPANPSTARGHSAHILLDEFAFHKDSRSIWKALFPTVTRGYKIRIISTPQGKKNKFYELWTAETIQIWDGLEYEHRGERGGYSKHRVTIADAVRLGLTLLDDEGKPCEPEDLRISLNDDEAWEQEYMVEFLDETTAWLTYDLIEGVEDQKILPDPSWVDALVSAAAGDHEAHKSDAAPPAFDSSGALKGVPFGGDLYLGMDIGRKKDLSVLWLDEEREGVYWTRAVIELNKQPFGVQKRVLFALLGLPGMRRACIDATGIGAQLGEEALERFSAKAEPVMFTLQSKEAMAVGIKRSFEDRRDRIPADQTIRQSLHSVKKETTQAGNVRFDADRTESTGHADHFWAKALGVMARSKVTGPVEYSSLAQRRGSFKKGAF